MILCIHGWPHLPAHEQNWAGPELHCKSAQALKQTMN